MMATICEGESYDFGGATYAHSGRYSYSLPKPEGCDSLMILDLVVEQQDSTLKEVTICEGESYELEGETYTEEGFYRIYQPNPHGCENLVELNLIVEKDGCIEIYTPNVISPSLGEDNSKFTIFVNLPSSVEIIDLRIYDRWGELIWHQENINPNEPALGWDGHFNGEPLNPAVFVWMATLEIADEGQQFLTGNLTLLR